MANPKLYIGGDVGSFKIGADDCHIYLGDELMYPLSTPTDKPYLAFVAEEAGTFKLSGNSVNYSTDNGATWATLASNTNSPTVPAGGKIMFKATLTPVKTKGIGTFSSTGRFTAQGNPMCLLFGDDFEDKTSLNGKDYAFRYIFSGSTGLTSAENISLPATTLAQHCYAFMFYNCTSLTTAPVLSATTLASRCYQYMFNNCTSLTTAPALPATTLVEYCYGGMFNGCTNLNSITCLATNISASNCTTNWVNGVASTGTFTKDSSMSSWTTGTNGIPSGWTVQNAS